MAQWAVIIPADQWATERLFHNEVVTVTGAAAAVAPDDEALLVADGHVVALTRAAKTDGDDLVLAYVRRSFDRPLPATELAPPAPTAPSAAGPAQTAPTAAPAAGPAQTAEPAPPTPSRTVVPAAGPARTAEPAPAAPARTMAAPAAEPARADVVPVAPELFRRLAAALGDGVPGERRPGPGARPTWLVSVALPIEADTPAEAVRQFWSHVRELGPAELPAYVWPSGDELAMQSFVLGGQANQDPEEDDD